MRDDTLEPAVVDHEEKLYYAGLYILKKMDLQVEDGGIRLEVPLEPRYAFLEEVLDRLMASDLVEIALVGQREKGKFKLFKKDAPSSESYQYKITPKGFEAIKQVIEEAEEYIEEFEEWETEDMVAELERRNLDVLRVRFLWGLYTGEFDDLETFQRRRGLTRQMEKDWEVFIMADAFYNILATDF